MGSLACLHRPIVRLIIRKMFVMKHLLLVAMAAVILVSATFAQQEAAKPDADHQKLNYFVGNWTTEGHMKPGLMGRGGKLTITENTVWMDGGFFIITHSTVDAGAMGTSTEIAVMGYDSDEKIYTYDEFSSTGEVTRSKGTFKNDTWTWMNDMKMGSQTVKGRYTVKVLSPTSYSYKFEMSDGDKWNLVMDGKSVKK